MQWPWRRGREAATQLELALREPDARATKIALLRGIGTVTVARSAAEIVVDRVLEGERAAKAGDIQLTLRACVRQDEDYRVDLELTSPRERLQWAGPESREIGLEDASGVAFPSPRRTSRSGTRYTLHFPARRGIGAPEKLRVPVVTEAYSRKIYFEMRDVPLRPQ